MPTDARKTLTEQQKKWFAGVIASMQAETGKTLEEWAVIAKTCPEATHGKRVQWFKAAHGLGQNRANIVLMHAFPEAGETTENLRAALWKDPGLRAILEAVEARLAGWPGLVAAQRKGYTPWARKATFAAMKPVKGCALLGIALDPSANDRLSPASGKEGWSERLTATLVLADPVEVDDDLALLLAAAFEAS